MNNLFTLLYHMTIGLCLVCFFFTSSCLFADDEKDKLQEVTISTLNPSSEVDGTNIENNAQISDSANEDTSENEQSADLASVKQTLLNDNVIAPMQKEHSSKVVVKPSLENDQNNNLLTVKLNKKIELAYAFLDDFKINLEDPESAQDTQINPNNYVALYLDAGLVIIKLFPDISPKTVMIFRKLVREGFYDNMLFYHVIPNYIIQTGDPTNSGYGGDGVLRPAEIDNNTRFVRGSVGMANLGTLESDSSQFFISYNDFNWLDNKYTLFGKVVAGMALFEVYTPNFSKNGLLINPLVINKMVVLSDLPKFRPKNKKLVKTYSKGGPVIISNADKK